MAAELLAAGVGGLGKAQQLVDCFALDAHGQRESADLQVGDAAVEHLAHQVGGLGNVQRPRALVAAADFLDVVGDAHVETLAWC